MADLEVSPVASWRDRRQFMNFPWLLYRGNPNWVPPLRANLREMLGWKHTPFYDNSRIQLFLARRGGYVVGRIAAIVNGGHNDYYKERRGFFGFFESVDDQQVADALFDAVRDWLADRGITDIRGPANPSVNHECGMLIDGFDSPPTFMMTYNPPYYERLVENWGFRKTQDLLAFIGYLHQLPGVAEKLGPMMEAARERLGAVVRPMKTGPQFLADVELFLEMYNRSLYQMWGFVPIAKDEIKHMARSLRFLLVPELALAAEADGQTVGAVLALPDYNPVIKRINGRLFPFGWVRLLLGKRHARRIRLVTINVLPEYQRWGLGMVLMHYLVPKALSIGVQEAEFSWVAESNHLARKGLEKGGAIHYKTYRMYDYPPPSSSSAAS
jgi:GNAT superfamily N-acetyltransferase